MEDIKINVAADLHPGVIEAIPGFTSDTAVHVEHARSAFKTAYERIGDIHKARAAAEADSSLTEGARILQVSAYAQQNQTAIAKSFDSAHAAMTKSINALEATLTEPLKAKAEPPASLVRSGRMKALTPAKRETWFAERQKAADFDSLEMILGSPGYLSGMTDDERTVRTKIYHRLRSPLVAQRVDLLKAADELITKRSGLALLEIEKAIGTSWGKVNRLKNARTESEKAFILRDKACCLITA